MSTICTDTTSLAHANKDDKEYFRAFGTLPFTRIDKLLDAQDDFIKAAALASGAIDDARDGMPCEDFAEDILYEMANLRDDESISDAMAEHVGRLMVTLETLQADLFQRAERAMKRLHDADEALADWLNS